MNGGGKGHRGGVDTLTAAWTLSLLCSMVSVPMALVRAYAYLSGARDHTPTMRTAMIVAVAIAGVSVLALVVTTVALLAR